MNADLVRTKDAAQLLGVSVATLNRWATEARIEPAVELPGRTGARLYSRAEIQALSEELQAEAAS